MSTKYSYALLKSGEKIHISDAVRGCHEYICRYCGNEMVAKKGTVKSHHFAHRQLCQCDPWYQGKGEWHRQMQDLFSKENQEVIVEYDGEKHIADVYLYKSNGQKLIIEFQKSPLSREEFITRTLFWKSNGADMIWVFNLEDKDIRELPDTSKNDEIIYEWKRPFFTLGDTSIQSVPVFFYIDPIVGTRYRWHHYADYDSQLFVEGGRKRFPIYVRVTHTGDEFCVNAKINDKVVEYSKSGYKLFKGERCYDFSRYVNNRMQTLCEDLFIKYKHCIWVALDSLPDFTAFKDKYVSKGNHGDLLEVSLRIYIRETKKVFMGSISVQSEQCLLESLTKDYGEENIVLQKAN